MLDSTDDRIVLVSLLLRLDLLQVKADRFPGHISLVLFEKQYSPAHENFYFPKISGQNLFLGFARTEFLIRTVHSFER